ncbi:50S ribosomal protein L5 [Candidatus Bathyarchaeota archaeon]|nr:50S ribosomal protein L5 [Candidatus Bathyarchaeota archaeon]
MAKKKVEKAKATDVESKVIDKKTVVKKKIESKVVPKKKTNKKITKSKVKKTVVSTEKKKLETEEIKPKVVKTPSKEWTKNPMLIPLIEKVTVNMSVGKSGGPLEQAVTIINQLTNQKPSKRKAKKTIREFGIRKGESIACLVTLRGENAKEFLRKAFYAVDNKLSKYCFDRQGNFSFGISEHIDIPGTKYSPELGIHGMDVSVSLGRAGYRVKRKHRFKSKIGKNHILTSQEAILFIKDEFDVEIM